jgi:hypothetical protein
VSCNAAILVGGYTQHGATQRVRGVPRLSLNGHSESEPVIRRHLFVYGFPDTRLRGLAGQLGQRVGDFGDTPSRDALVPQRRFDSAVAEPIHGFAQVPDPSRRCAGEMPQIVNRRAGQFFAVAADRVERVVIVLT